MYAPHQDYVNVDAQLHGEEMPTLSEAISAIKAGDKAGGKQMLAQILRAEPHNEQAWLWLAQVAASDDQRRYCLEQVLKIDPNHDLARRGLAILQQRQEPPVPAQQPGEPGTIHRLSRLIETGSGAPPATTPPPASSDLVKQARTLMAQGQPDQARQLLRQAVEINPGNEEAWEKLIDLAPGAEAQAQLFKEWLQHVPNSRRAVRKFKSLEQGGRSRMMPCLVIAGVLGLVLVLVLGGALVWFFWLDDMFKPTYLPEDVQVLLRLEQISQDEIRGIVYQAQDKKARELQAAMPYMADPVKAEETWGLYEYWINAASPRLMGHIEMRPVTPDETGGDPLDMGKAEFLIEFRSDSIITQMTEQEKTKYLHIEASRAKDENKKWQVASLEEIPPETVAKTSLSCTACPSNIQRDGLAGCLPYWQATILLLENKDITQEIPLMQSCSWIKVE